MANHFSAIKRARQTAKKTNANRANTSNLRTQMRKLREAIDSGDKAAALKILSETTAAIDKAASKGVLHRNTASRYKSRLALRINKTQAKAAEKKSSK
jgi:small subunit ribosomal protein S20